jgi:glycolate oxidase iron-sulfur subunit
LNRLLAQIPEISILTPSSKTACCGSAGDYTLKFPRLSQNIATKLAFDLCINNPDLIVSSSIGCILQLEKHCKIRVKHAINILAQQIILKT